MFAATARAIVGGATKQPPFNLRRYIEVEKKFATFAQFVELYFLDREITSAGFTILVPPDATLKKLIDEMKKIGDDYSSTKFITQQEKGRRYVLKGAVTPESVRASNAYVSAAGRAHFIYLDKDTMYIHDARVADAAAQKKGVAADLVIVAFNGSSLWTLKGELGVGADPLVQTPRNPSLSPRKSVTRLKKKKGSSSIYDEMYGGGGGAEDESAGCLPCSLIGGQLKRGTRYEIMGTLRDGTKDGKFGGYKDEWAKFVQTSLMQYLHDESVGDPTLKPIFSAACALLTGSPRADSLILLEPFVESPNYPDRKAADRKVGYLIPDSLIDGWYDNWEKNREAVEKATLYFKAERWTLIVGSGTGPGFTKVRADKSAALKREFEKVDTSDEKAMADLTKKINAELDEMYKSIGTTNQLSGADVFPKEVFKYLKETYKEALPAFLKWSNVLLFMSELFEDASKFEEWVAIAMPGFTHGEISNIFGGGFDTQSTFEIVKQGILGGYLPYLRSSLDAIGENFVQVVGGHAIMGGGYAQIDFKYRGECDAQALGKKRKTDRKGTKKRAEDDFPAPAPEVPIEPGEVVTAPIVSVPVPMSASASMPASSPMSMPASPPTAVSANEMEAKGKKKKRADNDWDGPREPEEPEYASANEMEAKKKKKKKRADAEGGHTSANEMEAKKKKKKKKKKKRADDGGGSASANEMDAKKKHQVSFDASSMEAKGKGRKGKGSKGKGKGSKGKGRKGSKGKGGKGKGGGLRRLLE